MASVNDEMWLNVWAKYAGTSDVMSAVNSEKSLCLVSKCDIRYAGMTSKLAKMFGIILNTKGSGIKRPKNARMASKTGLLINVLPP
jgi:hypothetical protein